MDIKIQKSVTVVTPSVGKHTLQDAYNSVRNQTYENVQHLIVWDGVVPSFPANCFEIQLPWNVGKDGYYGHRVYAAISHLLNTDYVCWLDEDNWFEPNHIETLVDALETGNDGLKSTNPAMFAYSLRSIYDKDGNYLLDDNCESLGHYPIYGNEANGRLIDTSSYMFRRPFIEATGHLFHGGWGADRKYLQTVLDQCGPSIMVGTKEHTLCYRLSGNDNSVSEEFFKRGNDITKVLYNDRYPWHTE